MFTKYSLKPLTFPITPVDLSQISSTEHYPDHHLKTPSTQSNTLDAIANSYCFDCLRHIEAFETKARLMHRF